MRKNRIIIFLLMGLLVINTINTIYPAAGRDEALENWDTDDKDLGWVSYALTDWDKLEDYLLYTSAIDSSSVISDPKVGAEVAGIKEQIKDILSNKDNWGSYDLSLWEGADDIEDYTALIQCVIDTIGRDNDGNFRESIGLGDYFGTIDPCQVVRFNVLNCAATYTTNSDLADKTSLTLIDGNTSICIFMTALIKSVETWSLQTNLSKTEISPYSLDGNLKACVANVYFPRYLLNYTAFYQAKTGVENVKKRSYERQTSGTNYYTMYKDTDTYKYSYSYTKGNDTITKNKTVPSAGKLIETISDKYVSSSVEVTVNANSKLKKTQIEQYLAKAKELNASQGALEALNYALVRVGWEYRYGAAHTGFLSNPNPQSYDCSSFVSYCWASAGYDVSQGRKIALATDGLRSMRGCSVSESSLLPGDIIVRANNHAMMYMGNNLIVHASSRKTGIKISAWSDYKAAHSGDTFYYMRPTSGCKQDEKLKKALGKYSK